MTDILPQGETGADLWHARSRDVAPPMHPQFEDAGSELPAKRSPRSVGTSVWLRSGQTVFNQGDASRYAYTIASGAVRLSTMHSAGHRQIVAFLFAGDMFGLESDRMHGLSAETLCRTELLLYPRALVERSGEALGISESNIVSLVRRDLAIAYSHLLVVGRQTAAERVASFLLKLMGDERICNGRVLELPMGRLDIADFLGLTMETVSRSLGTLRRKGIIGIPQRHRIEFKDVIALTLMAAGEQSGHA